MATECKYEVILKFGEPEIQKGGGRHTATGWENLTEERMLATVKAVSAKMKDDDEIIVTRSKKV